MLLITNTPNIIRFVQSGLQPRRPTMFYGSLPYIEQKTNKVSHFCPMDGLARLTHDTNANPGRDTDRGGKGRYVLLDVSVAECVVHHPSSLIYLMQVGGFAYFFSEDVRSGLRGWSEDAINMRQNILKETEDRRAALKIQQELCESMRNTVELHEKKNRLTLEVKVKLQNKIDTVDNGLLRPTHTHKHIYYIHCIPHIIYLIHTQQKDPLKRAPLSEIGGHLTRRRLSTNDWNPFVKSLDYEQRNALLSALVGSGSEGGRRLAIFVHDDVLTTSFTKNYHLENRVSLQEKIQVARAHTRT